MSLRKVHPDIRVADRRCSVYWDSEWEEFIVHLFENGVKNEGASYHTDDKNDAIETAKAMAATVTQKTSTTTTSFIEWSKPGRLANRKGTLA